MFLVPVLTLDRFRVNECPLEVVKLLCLLLFEFQDVADFLDSDSEFNVLGSIDVELLLPVQSSLFISFYFAHSVDLLALYLLKVLIVKN